MKYLKLTVVAVTAALTLAAFGANVAPADVICKEAPNASGECKTLKENSNSNNYLSGTEITVTSPLNAPAKLIVSASFEYISCHLTATFRTTSSGSNTPGAGVGNEVTDVEWSGCTTSSGASCSITTSRGYTGSFTTSGDAGNGIQRLSGSGIKIDVTCFGIFNCEYELAKEGITFSVNGGSPARGEASEQPLTLAHALVGCSGDGKWNAKYEVTSISGTTSKAFWLATKNV